MDIQDLKPSQRIRVQQTITTRSGPWQTQVDGTILTSDMQPTGSWYAHGRNDRLWLNRLRLQKDDGEIIDLVLNDSTIISPLPAR